MHRLFTRLFTGSPQAFSPPSDRVQHLEAWSAKAHKAITDLTEAVRAQEKLLAALREDLDFNAKAVQRLRGTVTGGLRRGRDGSVDEIPFGDRQALRAAAGIIPGRPFKHGS